MYPAKLLLFFLLVVFSAFNIQVSKPYLVKWVISNGCSLKVGGSTNINKFSCVIKNYSRPDTLTFYRKDASDQLNMYGALKLDVANFDCLNPVMTSDLRKTLKAKEYPKLVVRFLSLSKYPDDNKKENTLKGRVSIELAGVTKQFNVDYRVVTNKNNSLNVVGTRQINFSDFNIVPPRKIGGMIQTNNELNVEFNLNVKVLN